MKKPQAFIISEEKLQEVLAPPSKLIYIQHPREFWYQEKLDPRPHHRLLWLTYGIYLMEEWWKLHNIVISYPVTDYTQYYIKGMNQLKEYILEFHHLVAPHQRIQDCELVLGNGATQVLHAALYGTCIHHAMPSPRKGYLSLKPLFFTNQLPGYLDIQEFIESLRLLNARWVDISEAQQLSPNDLVEVVTSPNNPNGEVLGPRTLAQSTLFDRVNLWPFYMTKTPQEFFLEDLSRDWISIFSLPKILSFSGSRVGYAFVKDPKVAHNMRNYILKSTHGVASDSEVHCIAALKYLFEKNKLIDYMHWQYAQLARRWRRIEEALKDTDIKLLNSQGANAWVQTPTDAKLYLLKNYRIIATYGPQYGVDNVFARLNMTCTHNEFEELIFRLKNAPQIMLKKAA